MRVANSRLPSSVYSGVEMGWAGSNFCSGSGGCLLLLHSCRRGRLRGCWGAYIWDCVDEGAHARRDALLVGAGCCEEDCDGAVSYGEVGKDAGVQGARQWE